MLNNLYQRFTRMNAGQNPVNASDVSDDMVTTPSAGFRYAAGVGTMVTGTLAVATGLASVTAFFANYNASGAGTGTSGQQLIIPTIVAGTGAVTVTAFYISAQGASGAIAAASGSTGAFSWFAIGT